MTRTITLYGRSSTKHSVSDTTENQFSEMRRWAELNGYTVDGEFKDLCSGRELKCRVGLRKAIIHSKAVGSKIGVVESSRLSRSVKDTADLMDSKTEFIFTRDGIHMSKEMILVGSIFNQMSSEATSRRVKAGIQNLFETQPASRAEWGRARFRASTINRMTEMRITRADEFALKFGDYGLLLRNEGYTFREIAKAYNFKEIPTSRGGDNKWSAKTVRSLIIRFTSLTEGDNSNRSQ